MTTEDRDAIRVTRDAYKTAHDPIVFRAWLYASRVTRHAS